METKTIRILLIEDNPDDVFYLRMVLRKIDGASFQLEPCETLAAGLQRLRAGDIDVVLLDLTLPDSVGLDTFRAVKSQSGSTPVIVLSGVDDETVAVNAVHLGAEDYMVKGRVDSQLITRAIIYAIERNEARKAILKAEEKYRAIFENSVSGIFQTTPEGRYLAVNPALTRIYGYDSPEDLISGLTDIARRLYVEPNRRSEFIRLMQTEGVVQNFESKIFRKNGSIIWISENARAVRDSEGRIVCYEGMVEDITARREAEEKLRLSETRFRSVWDNTFDGMRLTEESGIIVAVNPSFCNTVGLEPGELIGTLFHSIYSDSRDKKDLMERYMDRFQNHRTDAQVERRVTFRTGRTVDLELSNSFIESTEGRVLLLSVFRDITKRKRAEERERLANLELARSQAELRKKNDIMEEEINMAREIQQAMLPQQYPSFPPGAPPDQSLLRFSHRYLPTSQVGGDFFNVLPLSDAKAGLFICDVMGHGVRSALVTAMVRALVEELRPIALNPGLFLTRINSDLRAILQLAGTPLFTTAFYLVVDLENRELLYANAGHPKPFLIHRDTREVESLKNADGRSYPALGLFPDSTYPTNRCAIRAADAVMLFTDGIYEVEGRENQQFSQGMLIDVLRKRLNLEHCGELFDAILAEVQEFSATNSFSDDVCLVGMEITENLK